MILRMSLEIITPEKFKSEIFDYTTEKEFEFKGETPIILNFFATWCGPCHAFAPALETVAAAHEAQLKVFKIDIDQHPEVPALFGVRSVPTTVFFSKGEQPALVMGNIGEENLKRAVGDLFGLKS